MGNMGSSLFGTPQEKEFRKLTKKNTKVNRLALLTMNTGPDYQPGRPKDPERKRRLAQTPLRFENLITEVTYDREEGEIEVTRESLNHESEDALGNEVILDLVPTTVPVVAAGDAGDCSPTVPRRKGGVFCVCLVCVCKHHMHI